LSESPLLDEIRKLLDLKMQSGEAHNSSTSASWPVITAFIEEELEAAQSWQADKLQKLGSEPLDTLLHEAVLYCDSKPHL